MTVNKSTTKESGMLVDKNVNKGGDDVESNDGNDTECEYR